MPCGSSVSDSDESGTFAEFFRESTGDCDNEENALLNIVGDEVVIVPRGLGSATYTGDLTFIKQFSDPELLVLQYDPDDTGPEPFARCLRARTFPSVKAAPPQRFLIIQLRRGASITSTPDRLRRTSILRHWRLSQANGKSTGRCSASAIRDSSSELNGCAFGRTPFVQHHVGPLSLRVEGCDVSPDFQAVRFKRLATGNSCY